MRKVDELKSLITSAITIAMKHKELTGKPMAATDMK